MGSGLTFNCYFVGLDKTELKFMPFYKLIFALCLITVICGGALGFVTKQLTFALTAKAWGYMLILALTSTLVATGLLQRGIQLTDGATAAILSTFEPTTSFFFAAAILGEEVNAIHILGCGLIVLSVVVLARSKAGRER